MVDRPDNVPALDELRESDPLPEWWAEETTITCRRYTKQRLDTHRDGRPWDVFLEQLRQSHADPVTMNDIGEIADAVAREANADVDTGELALAVADYLMNEYNLPAEVASEMEGRVR
jgi:hypothetical protein